MINPKTPLQLYKYLLREINKLPSDARGYYRHFVRQQFNSHTDETEPERIQQIIEQSVKDAHWIVHVKYKIPEEPQKESENK